ncbi:hypothetical protein EAS61_24205 [Bradyrhizobium zhanjiangense]|uniref:Uncharacterized protein n=1 Tax=Bradyrhizobium zhanjiangense TaxID=1325107 RepID=A0A4V1KVT4_9BRAD|nr:hypothetical protein EAS61_24205 [Bradyrhizobium zhanjiangense]
MRAQRSNPESLRGGSLDCFVASAQNCFAILSRAPRNDGVCGDSERLSRVPDALQRASVAAQSRDPASQAFADA